MSDFWIFRKDAVNFEDGKKSKYIEDLLEEIDSLYAWHRQLHKSDDGHTRSKETNLDDRIEKLQNQYKELTGNEYVHFFNRK